VIWSIFLLYSDNEILDQIQGNKPNNMRQTMWWWALNKNPGIRSLLRASLARQGLL